MMVGGCVWVMVKPLLTLNAASSPSSFGLEVMTLLMANPDMLFGIQRRGEIVEVMLIESVDD